ncbi:MAG TPA: DUF4185 domain-containing protein [Thermoanaerobaculia bacterium]|nr:DUF4185 domain-containing protein [Thermoanaerobaculia bacterium]
MQSRIISISLVLAFSIAAAEASNTLTTLTWIPGSSVRVEQIVGDCDYPATGANGSCKATISQTVTHAKVLGNDLGSSFEDQGKLIFVFGDTIGPTVNYHAGDTMAASTSTDPSNLLLTFYTNIDGSPFFVQPPGVQMGADDVPDSGISLPTGTYIVCNTGADTSLTDPHAHSYSILTRFDEATKTFVTGRTISMMPGGHFVIPSLHASGTDVLMFGVGDYRASDVYLATVPGSSFESGTGTRYFAGLVGGQPTWTTSESAAVPVVVDNPLDGPPWPNDDPTIGNNSVIYSQDLGLWLMTYDGGRQSQATTGIYFSYAADPWGPWSMPQLIFNSKRDHGLGVFIHDPTILPDPPGDGLNGPTIGGNDPYSTRGATYAPFMIERFTKAEGDTLTIYYTMSTWNPYTVVEMRSQFAISRESRRHAARH